MPVQPGTNVWRLIICGAEPRSHEMMLQAVARVTEHARSKCPNGCVVKNGVLTKVKHLPCTSPRDNPYGPCSNCRMGNRQEVPLSCSTAERLNAELSQAKDEERQERRSLDWRGFAAETEARGRFQALCRSMPRDCRSSHKMLGFIASVEARSGEISFEPQLCPDNLAALIATALEANRRASSLSVFLDIYEEVVLKPTRTPFWLDKSDAQNLLANAIGQHPNLTNIHIMRSALTDGFMHALAPAIEANSMLRKVSLHGVICSESAADAVSKAWLLHVDQTKKYDKNFRSEYGLDIRGMIGGKKYYSRYYYDPS